jgi:ABC-2 type transport system ATP-binding protein
MLRLRQNVAHASVNAPNKRMHHQAQKEPLMATTEIVIETHGLGKTYKEVSALKSLDLTVHKNSIFGFLGPNGAGKTTTIKLLLGLAKPTAGSATVFAHDIVRDNVEIRKRVGYLAQDPRYYEYMTARQTLRYVAHFFFTGPEKEIEARVANTLELVGLDDKADRPIKGFSGGERQRLGIAQAQINYPDLLILDEPAASLDPQGRRDVLEVMERLRKHTTIFYSTHILSDVQRVSDTVAILNKGQLVAQAPIEQLLAGGSGSTIYVLTLKGDPAQAQQRVAAQSWVTGIIAKAANTHTDWQVTVTDEAAAEEQLLRLVLADPQVKVLEFGRKKYELEEVFLGLVEGNHGQ